MNNIRVLYISPIANPFGISRYRYYNLIVKDNKFLIIGDDGEISEYTKEEIQEYYRLEVGAWEDYFISITVKKPINEELIIEEMEILKNNTK